MTTDLACRRLHAALALARRGAAIFPLWWADDGICACGSHEAADAKKHSIAKHPIGTAAPRGCRDATRDERRIRGWWARWPRANIGLATGAPSGCWVLDVDGAAGVQALEELERTHGPLPRTAAARTGRAGGLHLYWRLPTDRTVRNSASKLAAGLDVRGDGGYVVAPPSIHASGRRYEWTSHGGSRVDAPPWLLELVVPSPTTRTSSPSSSSTSSSSPSPSRVALADRVAAYVHHAAWNELEAAAAAPEGTRNERLNQAAYALGRFVAGGLLDELEVRTSLREAAERQGPWQARRLETLIDRALADASRDPRRRRDVEADIQKRNR